MKRTMKHIAALTTGIVMLSAYNISAAQDSSIDQAVPAVEQIVTQAPTINAADEKATRLASWNGQKVAISGRDVVSFHNNEKPLKGKRKYVAEYDNTKWRFASEENRDLFLEDPDKYVPEFGGFCPVALAKNKAKVGHVNQYSFVDDKLYFNYDSASKSAFKNDADNLLLRAQLNF